MTSPAASSSESPDCGGARRPESRRGAVRRWARRALIACAVALGVFAASTAGLFVWPPQGMPTRVDAIIMLAGPGDRLPVAVQLAREGRAPVLVVSQGHLGYGGPCPAAVPGVALVCFDPDPADTRGEAEYIARLAEREHWRSLTVVATPEQDIRARLIVGRCYPGTIYVVTAPVPWQQLPYQVAYGWAALFKALILQRSC